MTGKKTPQMKSRKQILSEAKSDNHPPAGRDPNSLWGGRFAEGPGALMQQINASIEVDKRLWREDIEASRAHAQMLVKTGIISKQDGKAIDQGLQQITAEIEQGHFTFSADLEDIHMNIEARLHAIIGDAAGRLHTARSRNDQVATDFRLYCRRACTSIIDQLNALQHALLQQAQHHTDSLMPGFTHLQTAQPISFGHHLLAYVEMFERDKARMQDARDRLNECPLGAAALAGTGFPIDRKMTARKLGFAAPMGNSLDAVSSRDFVMEIAAALAIKAVHLSRLAEELILWSSPQFRFIRLPDRFTTGSSIMPQKRNPDAAELVRAKAAGSFACLQSLLVMMKALPLAYAKDMQEDKRAFFATYDDSLLSLAAMTGMVQQMQVNKAMMAKAADADHATATDLADILVRDYDIPFRQAHTITGQLVALAEKRGCLLKALPVADMKKIDKRLGATIRKALDPKSSLNARTSYGGTAPQNVQEQITRWQKKLL